jgi:trans-aconitate 2-methyltransferase
VVPRWLIAQRAAGGSVSWDPTQYNRFAAEREQPFWDLVSLLQPTPSPANVVDLGCGDGRLTAALHDRLGARSTLGIDSSPSMLAGAPDGIDGLSFTPGDIATWIGDRYDVVFANASLQWVPAHDAALRRWRDSLAPGGQLAVQVPANADHPSHTVLASMAPDVPDPVATNVLPPERYAELLHALGFVDQHVRLQVYPHVLDTSADVVEWMKGTSLTRLGDRGKDPTFVDEYRRRLLDVIGDGSPYLYAFKRILLWGRL